jgi:hypothetical protein
MYSSFNDIIDKMVTPEQNQEDFFKLVLTSDIDWFKGKLIFTQNFNYDLNPSRSQGTFFRSYLQFKANVFLKSISKLSEDEIIAYKDSITNKDFLSFMEYLSNISKEDFEDLVSINRDHSIKPGDMESKRLIEYYKKHFEHLKEEDDIDGLDFNPASRDWYYFRSYYISPSMKESFHTKDVKHRLYISIDYDQLLNFTRDFVKILEGLQIPYLMKMKSCQPSGKCIENDTLVIYADSEERITDYVNILRELINAKDNYKNAIHKPSAHLGIIDNQIGYGREFGPKTSYSGEIGEISEDAFIYALKDVSYGPMLSRQYTRKEMLEELEISRKLKRPTDAYNDFKDRFWKKFEELMEQKGYEIDDYFCLAEREVARTFHN